ncbi:alpha/beta fold hydrolase [Flavobacterium wongokense]|uniref:alpha/beta fold hydrolase n=1 Tax=Flavobacterium wongokense TaxID=2910674 RepID=UPI001F428BB8|nr:alpha/beta hydrolase [Flavobacterium sp. WG47]MCF6132456.1 alpha/beta hydrolase [Flavobacterium sp. WG47]
MTKKADIPNQTLQIPKVITRTAKFLQAISPKLATLFAAKLFTTPLKHRIPKRELDMEKNSRQEKLFVPKINKEINIYHYGETKRKVLLVHGWSGRGTQLVKIADELLNKGFSTISFDAPAHGKSGSKTTLMPEFIASILEIEKQFGPFEFAVGHSLGGMSILNAIKQGLKIKKAVIIGSGDIIQDILDDFVLKMELKPGIASMMKAYFEKKHQVAMESYSASLAARSVEIPVLVIHDENDEDINLKAAHNIHQHLKNSKLLITKKLGHRKILGDKNVIENIINFISN